MKAYRVQYTCSALIIIFKRFLGLQISVYARAETTENYLHGSPIILGVAKKYVFAYWVV